MRHAVLGPGGVGGLVAAALARDGQEVMLILRAEALESYPGGLYVESRVLGEIDVEIPAASRLDRSVDVLWITVKAVQLEEAVGRASPAVARDALVVPLLNGIDHVQWLREVYGEGVVAGAIRVESERVGLAHVVQSSPFAAIELAPPAELRRRTMTLARELQSAGLACRLRDSEAELLWGKLAMLAPFALATTSSRQAAGGVRSDPATCGLMLAASREVCAVAATQGVVLDPASYEKALLNVPDEMRSSMQKDLAAGRPLELDAISRPVLRLAREHGVETPATEELVRRVAHAKAL